MVHTITHLSQFTITSQDQEQGSLQDDGDDDACTAAASTTLVLTITRQGATRNRPANNNVVLREHQEWYLLTSPHFSS